MADQLDTSRILEIVENRDFRVVYQPLLDLRMNKPYAYECLVRCSVKGFEPPPVLIDAAVEHGVMGRLGRELRQMAIDNCPDAPLFLNVHPNEFAEGWLVRPDDPLFQHEHPIYLEITESVPLSHFDYCHSVLQEVRSKGIHLAVDDLGAGYSNLKYIADLAPDVVKLDRELITNLARGTRLHKLVTHIVRLCEDLGARVVAEGIETEDELYAIRDTGAHYGQGYFIARPAFPIPEVAKFGLEPPAESELPTAP